MLQNAQLFVGDGGERKALSYFVLDPSTIDQTLWRIKDSPAQHAILRLNLLGLSYGSRSQLEMPRKKKSLQSIFLAS